MERGLDQCMVREIASLSSDVQSASGDYRARHRTPHVAMFREMMSENERSWFHIENRIHLNLNYIVRPIQGSVSQKPSDKAQFII